MVEVDIAKLAHLARIAMTEKEIEELKREIPDIIAFVDQITQAGGEVTKETGDHYNIMREDEDPHESGKYTKEMVDAMPNSKDGYLRVRKIITQD